MTLELLCWPGDVCTWLIAPSRCWACCTAVLKGCIVAIWDCLQASFGVRAQGDVLVSEALATIFARQAERDGSPNRLAACFIHEVGSGPVSAQWFKACSHSTVLMHISKFSAHTPGVVGMRPRGHLEHETMLSPAAGCAAVAAGGVQPAAAAGRGGGFALRLGLPSHLRPRHLRRHGCAGVYPRHCCRAARRWTEEQGCSCGMWLVHGSLSVGSLSGLLCHGMDTGIESACEQTQTEIRCGRACAIGECRRTRWGCWTGWGCSTWASPPARTSAGHAAGALEPLKP